MPQNHKTLEDLRKAAILAEKTVLSTYANAASASASADDITKHVLDAVTDKLSEVLALGVDRRVEPDPQPPQTWSRQRQVDARSRRTPQQTQKPCRRCGGKIFHPFKECAAYGVTCRFCKGPIIFLKVVIIEIVGLIHNHNRDSCLSVRVILSRMGTEMNCQMTAEQPRRHSKTIMKWKSMLPPL